MPNDLSVLWEWKSSVAEAYMFSTYIEGLSSVGAWEGILLEEHLPW